MSLSRATVKRLPQIKEGFRHGYNYTQIGQNCGVTEKTIDRDIHSWVESGLFEIWLKEEFLDLHHYARDNNPLEAYKEIAKIVGKMVTRRVESKHTEEIREIKLTWIKDESNPSNKVQASQGAK